MDLLGIHHVTAVSANIQENYKFYTNVMGMRLVKRSVNQDDVTAYHLFYSGDKRGTPGNDLTFFDWSVPREQRGTHSITRTYLRVTGADAVTWWADWLTTQHVEHKGVQTIDGRATILFDDPEGQRLAIVDDGGLGGSHEPWTQSPVPYTKQIRGQGPIVLSVPTLDHTDAILTIVMNMRPSRTYPHPDNTKHTIHVYEMASGGPHAEVHVAVQPNLPSAGPGAGGVHHVAFRTPTDEEYHKWADRLKMYKIPNSGKVDRFWFRSLYFREPNGILFEIATDEPGFTIDEDSEALGEKVVLPPFLESRRTEIVSQLKPLD